MNIVLYLLFIKLLLILKLMKFLDETGLGYFLDKLKEFIKKKYVGINNDITITNSDNNLIIKSNAISLANLNNNQLIKATNVNNDSIYFIYKGQKQIEISNKSQADIDPYIELTGYVKCKFLSITNGNNNNLLLSNGSWIKLNGANGVPKLDANGKLDSAQIVALSNSDIDAIVI